MKSLVVLFVLFAACLCQEAFACRGTGRGIIRAVVRPVARIRARRAEMLSRRHASHQAEASCGQPVADPSCGVESCACAPSCDCGSECPCPVENAAMLTPIQPIPVRHISAPARQCRIVNGRRVCD